MHNGSNSRSLKIALRSEPLKATSYHRFFRNRSNKTITSHSKLEWRTCSFSFQLAPGSIQSVLPFGILTGIVSSYAMFDRLVTGRKGNERRTMDFAIAIGRNLLIDLPIEVS